MRRNESYVLFTVDTLIHVDRRIIAKDKTGKISKKNTKVRMLFYNNRVSILIGFYRRCTYTNIFEIVFKHLEIFLFPEIVLPCFAYNDFNYYRYYFELRFINSYLK